MKLAIFLFFLTEVFSKFVFHNYFQAILIEKTHATRTHTKTGRDGGEDGRMGQPPWARLIISRCRRKSRVVYSISP